MRVRLDDHGQPVVQALCAKMVTERQIDELIGICKGVIADGEINRPETEFLVNWLEHNRSAASRWPGNLLYARIRRALLDKSISCEEERELIHLLADLSGGQPVEHAASMSTALPLCDPPPPIVFEQTSFCFTGKFIFGSRRECESVISTRGGRLHSSPVRDTNYLVIGMVGSRDWIHSTYGRKIERAVELRRQGFAIGIVSEEYWVAQI